MKLIVEGSGANAKYYAQIGADTASKKLLGKISAENIKVLANYSAASGTNIVKKGTYTATDDMTVLVSYFYDGSSGRPETDGLVLYQSPQISATGPYYYALSVISLKKGQYITTYSRQNGEGYVLRLC